MITKIIQENEIEKAIQYVKQGKIIIYPTESCYALGVNALDEQAIMKIRNIKGRYDKAITVIVSDLNVMKKYGYIGKRASMLADTFMPGPLTLVVDKKEIIPDILDPNEIAFRISSHPVAHELVKKFGGIITTTSANISGNPPIYKISEILSVFNNRVDLIINGGNLEKNPVSTILSLRANIPYIKREGVINNDILFSFLKKNKIYVYNDYKLENKW
jgi:L-threonylcarbamoyladenylate synthase